MKGTLKNLMTKRQEQRQLPLPLIKMSQEVLQLPTLDLYKYIQQVESSNPLIECNSFFEKENSEIEKNIDVYKIGGTDGYDSTFSPPSYSSPYNQSSPFSNDEKKSQRGIENIPDKKAGRGKQESIRFLLFQIKEHFKEEKERFIAIEILKNLDEKGFFPESIETLFAEMKASLSLEKKQRLGITGNIQIEEVKRVLKTFQTFEPLGIGSQSLQELLLLQLDRKSLGYRIVTECFEAMKKQDLTKISKKLSLDIETVLFAIKKEILPCSFSPLASANFSSYNEELPFFQKPDITIDYEEGKWSLFLVDMGKNVHLLDRYEDLKNLNEEEKNQLKTWKAEGSFLLRAIKMREDFLLKIACFLIETQKEFFLQKKPLFPLRIKEVAKKLKMHPSSLHRALRDKTIQTPCGLIPLKALFSAPINSDISLDHAKKMLLKLIEKEDKQQPFSDEKLVLEMRKEGISLSRRVVNKYRKELHILSSRFRKMSYFTHS